MTTRKSAGWHDHDVKPTFDLAVVIGRFQPVHKGHLKLFGEAALLSDHRLALVGSSFIARDIKNPFTYQERRDMIAEAVNGLGSFGILPVSDDLYNDQVWVGNVQTQVNMMLEERGIDPTVARVAIVGHHKDATSYYLDMFPTYTLVECDSATNVSGTDIREHMFGPRILHSSLPPTVKSYLKEWSEKHKDVYNNLCGEHEFIGKYRKQFAGLAYPPFFVTVDAVVINHGHVLLVKRKSHPGKGLWALPGGFLAQNEFVEQSMVRELKEETRIAVNDTLLKASLKGVHVFDAPNRSLRGRTITHAGLFVLNTQELPKVKGADDAETAKWVPLAQFYEMTDQLFEDHYSIGTYMVSRAG